MSLRAAIVKAIRQPEGGPYYVGSLTDLLAHEELHFAASVWVSNGCQTHGPTFERLQRAAKIVRQIDGQRGYPGTHALAYLTELEADALRDISVGMSDLRAFQQVVPVLVAEKIPAARRAFQKIEASRVRFTGNPQER